MECSELLRTIGERVRTLRKSQRLSQEKLAELASLHPVFISKVETGKVRASICTYLSVADALGVGLSDLLDLRQEREPSDVELLALFQSAKQLNEDKRSVFVQAVKGLLSGLGGA